MVLSGMPSGDLGFSNMYVPNSLIKRGELWCTMVMELPIDVRLVLGGDFNMVEARNGKSKCCSKLIPLDERRLFNKLKRHLSIVEQVRSPISQ